MTKNGERRKLKELVLIYIANNGQNNNNKKVRNVKVYDHRRKRQTKDIIGNMRQSKLINFKIICKLDNLRGTYELERM